MMAVHMLLLVTLMVSMLSMQPTVAQTNIPAGIVMNPPKFTYAEPGQTVRITCVAYGYPLPTITWSQLNDNLAAKLDDTTSGYKQFDQTTTMNGKQFQVSMLEICGVSLAEVDEYFCSASNTQSGQGIGDATYGFFINVQTDAPQEPPSLVVRPPESGNSAQYGSTVEAVCVAYGNPMPTISWAKQGCSGITCVNNVKVFNQVLSMGDVMYRKSTLQLCNVDESNSGTYTCSADNGVDGMGMSGLKSFAWQLSVDPKPPVMSTSEMPYPTTTCPEPPTAPMTSSNRAGNSPQPSVDRSTSSFSGLEESQYTGIAIAEGVLIIILLIGVSFAILMVIKQRGGSKSVKAGRPAQSTGFEQRADEKDDAGLSYSNLVRRMDEN